jgi:hypothetical protein
VAKALTVPPNLVGRVREGTYGVLAAAAEAIVQSAHAHEQPEPSSRPNQKDAEAILDRLGWTSDQDPQQAIELEPEHRQTLYAAIEAQVPLLAEWLDDLDPVDPGPSRPRRGATPNLPVRSRTRRRTWWTPISGGCSWCAQTTPSARIDSPSSGDPRTTEGLCDLPSSCGRSRIRCIPCALNGVHRVRV